MLRTREFCKKTVTEELRPGDVVQHFKRGMTNSDDHNAYLYKIICEAIHTETKEIPRKDVAGSAKENVLAVL